MGDRKPITPLVQARRSMWALAAYLLGFAILIAIVSIYFLLPGADAIREADRTGQQQLSAVSALLMVVVLFICLMGLILTVRFGRFFFPHANDGAREKTEYVDAWAESAKRMKSAPSSDSADEDDPLKG